MSARAKAGADAESANASLGPLEIAFWLVQELEQDFSGNPLGS
jgi:hypothetical protein